jgi:hypothetical protein
MACIGWWALLYGAGPCVMQAPRLRMTDIDSLRHSFAAHPLDSAHGIRTLRYRLHQSDASTTVNCTPILGRRGRGVVNRLDRA